MATSEWDALFAQSDYENGLRPGMTKALAIAESSLNPNAVSGAGAQGIMQFMPETAKGLGIDPLDPAQAIPAGGRYLGDLMRQFGGNERLALAGYNAGPGNARTAVEQNWSETAQHYKNVMSNMTSIPTGFDPNGGMAQPGSYGVGFNFSNEKEPLDYKGIMNALIVPQQNAGAKVEDAIQRQLVMQADHRGLGRLQAEHYKDSDEQLMKAAITRAQEETKIANEGAKLTAAGKIAKMISESKSSSNSAAYAMLAKNLGINVDPMASRYVNPNALAEMQYKTNAQIAAEQRAFAQKKELMAMEQAHRMQLAAMGGGRGGGGGRGSKGKQYNIGAYEYTDYGDDKDGKQAQIQYVDEESTLTPDQRAKNVARAVKLGSDWDDKIAEAAEEAYATGSMAPVDKAFNEYGGLLSTIVDGRTRAEMMAKAKNDYDYLSNDISSKYKLR